MKRLTKDIRRVGLVANSDKKNCRAPVQRACRLILESGRSVRVDEATARLTGVSVPTCRHAAQLTREVDLLMVFGGDGTMLRVAREVSGSRTPIVGINAGGLGFLTDVPTRQLSQALRQIWAGETRLEARPLMEAQGRAFGKPFHQRALNDFVVSRGAAPRLIELEVSVDGEVLTHYRCDGLIVCSPTGSTAYSLAAGGAVVSPEAEVFSITPICPHTLSNRSVIVSMRSEVHIRVLSERVETVLTADGQTTVPLGARDGVTIRRGRRHVQLLHLAGSSFFQTLRHKLNWSGSNVGT